MIIGVPKEIKEGEKRVAMTPQGVDALVSHHHRVLVEKGAGKEVVSPTRSMKELEPSSSKALGRYGMKPIWSSK